MPSSSLKLTVKSLPQRINYSWQNHNS